MPEIIVKLGDRIVQKYLLYKDQRMTIGRAPDNDIAIENPAVSRRHSSIQQVNGRHILEDNNSANGTYVNGVRISKTEIVNNDVITIGKHKLHFYNHDLSVAQQPAGDDRREEPAAASSRAHLRIVQGKQREAEFELNKTETRIGRAADNDIRLHDWYVSKHHAVIGRRGSNFILRDLDSWRHTIVNGEVVQEHLLRNGDEIQFGHKITMRFELEASDEDLGGRQPVELSEGEIDRQPVPRSEWEERGTPIDMAMAAMEEEASPQLANEVTSEREFQNGGSFAHAAGAGESQAPEETPGERSQSDEDSHRTLLGHADESWGANGAGDEETICEPVGVILPSDTVIPAADQNTIAGVQDFAGAGEEKAPSLEPGDKPVTRELPAEPVLTATRSEPANEDVAMWEKALQNPSKIIRKQAARKLKQLTGRDYDIE